MQVSICGLRAYEFLDEFGVYIGVAEAVAILRILSDSSKQKEDLVCVQHSPQRPMGRIWTFSVFHPRVSGCMPDHIPPDSSISIPRHCAAPRSSPGLRLRGQAAH